MPEFHRFLYAIPVLVGIAATGAAMAAEGRTPVFAPTVIVMDGKYIVTRNIMGSGAAPVVEIAAANVDLDLNGFTLTEPGGGFAVILVSAFSEVTIRNGTLVSGIMSVDAPVGGRKLILEDVKSQDALGGAPGALHAFGVENVVIRRCVVVGAPGMPGIFVEGPLMKSGTIEKNVIRDSGGGIWAMGVSSLSILENAIEGTTPGSATPGIALMGAGNLIALNTIQEADGPGIDIRTTSQGNKLYNNVVFSSGGHGIAIGPSPLALATGNNLVLDNVVTFSGGSGLWVAAEQNKIEGNVLNENAGCGLFFVAATSVGNTFGRNMARGNAGVACGPAICPPLFWPDSCDGGVANDSYGDNLIPGPPVF